MLQVLPHQVQSGEARDPHVRVERAVFHELDANPRRGFHLHTGYASNLSDSDYLSLFIISKVLLNNSKIVRVKQFYTVHNAFLY